MKNLTEQKYKPGPTQTILKNVSVELGKGYGAALVLSVKDLGDASLTVAEEFEKRMGISVKKAVPFSSARTPDKIINQTEEPKIENGAHWVSM